MPERCVCCGAVIPEGRQVCPSCEGKKMANEKRLIDANVLKKALCTKEGAEALGHSTVKLARVLAIVDAQQKVDAVEVIHGRWEDEHGGKYANPRYRCSVCKERSLYKFERDLLDNWKEIQALTPVCSYCMAKMDGGNEDG